MICEQVFRHLNNLYYVFFFEFSYASGVRKLINAHYWAGYPKKAKKINGDTHIGLGYTFTLISAFMANY
jgi:hypothetical protein